MHDRSTQPTVTQNSSTSVRNTLIPTAALNPTAPVFLVLHSSTTLFVGSSKAVLLQTAVTEVYNTNNPASTLKLRLILGSGSQRSYLTEQVKHTLSLERVKRQHLSIATFRAFRGDPRHCEVVCVGISTTCGQGELLELLIIPHICKPLSTQPVDLCSKMYTHLAPLTLADAHHSDTPFDVDMLIGSDFYWQLTSYEEKQVLRPLTPNLDGCYLG